ncbi:MAG: DMT family transporter [bacterium]|nr:MAG: DMT family transporter [bacterium]
MDQRGPADQLAPIFVIIAASLWGVDGIVLRPALFDLPVPLVVFIESLTVAFILTPFFWKRFAELGKLGKRDWMIFLGIALFGGALGTMAITRALFYVNFVNLSIVILIQKLQPVFAIILAAILLRERPQKRFFFWAVIAIIGAYFVTFGINRPAINATDKTGLAALLSLLAAFSFGASTVLSKRGLKNVDFRLATYIRFALTAILVGITLPVFGLTRGLSLVTSHHLVIFLLIAFTTGGLAIFLYYYGLKKISASVATICELSFPITAVILEYLLRRNFLDSFQWLGVILLIYSIIKVSRVKISTREPVL